MATGNMTAVVFGGGGFIGRHLVRRLGKTGAVVRVPSRHVSKLGFLRTAGVVGQIVPEMVSGFDEAELTATIRGADVVINLIGILAEGGKNSFDRIHTDLPARIAKVAAANGVKQLIQVSALGVADAATSSYARSKLAGEEAVRAAFPRATIIRPSIVFGPEDQFFNRFAAMARISPALPLIGGGQTKFQPVYVGDVADGIMAAIAHPEAAGKIYEFGGPSVYSFKALMEILLAEIGIKRFLVPLPWGLADFQAGIAERVPGKPLTRDQVALLKYDNVLSGAHPGLADLGVTPSAVELILPTYLDRFLKGGKLGRQGRVFP
jgi:NADH dehydrogenase